LEKVMKKLFTILFALAIGVAIIAPEQKAEAQPIYGGFCCDAAGFRRCVINLSPVGSPCFCYGQGSGWCCL